MPDAKWRYSKVLSVFHMSMVMFPYILHNFHMSGVKTKRKKRTKYLRAAPRYCTAPVYLCCVTLGAAPRCFFFSQNKFSGSNQVHIKDGGLFSTSYERELRCASFWFQKIKVFDPRRPLAFVLFGFSIFQTWGHVLIFFLT